MFVAASPQFRLNAPLPGAGFVVNADMKPIIMRLLAGADENAPAKGLSFDRGRLGQNLRKKIAENRTEDNYLGDNLTKVEPGDVKTIKDSDISRLNLRYGSYFGEQEAYGDSSRYVVKVKGKERFSVTAYGQKDFDAYCDALFAAFDADENGVVTWADFTKLP